MKRKHIVVETAGIWKGKVNESSIDHVTKIRKEWSSREKRLRR